MSACTSNRLILCENESLPKFSPSLVDKKLYKSSGHVFILHMNRPLCLPAGSRARRYVQVNSNLDLLLGRDLARCRSCELCGLSFLDHLLFRCYFSLSPFFCCIPSTPVLRKTHQLPPCPPSGPAQSASVNYSPIHLLSSHLGINNPESKSQSYNAVI